MSIMRPEEYEERVVSLEPFQVHVVSYRLDGTYHCVVDNLDPGTVIVRSEGRSRGEAEGKALRRAESHLASWAKRAVRG